MAKLKRLKYNSDFMSEKMDTYMEQIEDRLSALYANAAYDVNQKFAEFAKGFEKQDANMLAQVEAGKISQEEYTQWRSRKMLQDSMYRSTVDEMSTMLVNTDVAAMALVNSAMPSVVAQSYNFTQALGFEAARKAGITQGTFQVYNARSVQKIVKDNPKLLKEVDRDADTKWNREKINREITAGIVQGEPIPKISDRLQRVAHMDNSAATRNARTAMTAAENIGRSEAADELKEQGIPMEEVWSATYDDRTRESHLMLDGTVRDENGYFGADFLIHPLRFPADPDGDPEEIYNCRCRMSLQLKGIDHSNDKELYEQFMKDNYEDTYDTLKDKDYFDRFEKPDLNPKENEEKPKDFIASKGEQMSSQEKVRAEEISQMSRDELKREFVDSDSYIYDPKYTSLESERSALSKETTELRDERQRLAEELKGERTIKPKDEWDVSDELSALLGEKPVAYTERGEEITNLIDQIRAKEKPLEGRLMDVRDQMEAIDKKNAIEQIKEWDSKEHPFEKGDINKEYEGFSTKMDIPAFDSDLQEGIGFIAEMSPDEYIDRIAYDVFGSTRENTVDIWYDNVKEYASMMANGVKFDMGYIDYKDKGQEGRHRAMAAKLLGIEKIPVYIRGRRP